MQEFHLSLGLLLLRYVDPLQTTSAIVGVLLPLMVYPYFRIPSLWSPPVSSATTSWSHLYRRISAMKSALNCELLWSESTYLSFLSVPVLPRLLYPQIASKHCGQYKLIYLSRYLRCMHDYVIIMSLLLYFVRIWYNRVPRGVLLFSASDLQFPGTPLMIYITVKSAGKIVTTPTSLLLEYGFLTDPRLEVSNAKGGDPKLGKPR